MDNIAKVKRGGWIDNSRAWPNNRNYTLTKGWNIFIQLFLGVLLGAATPCVSAILTRCWEWVLYGRHLLSRRFGTSLSSQRNLGEDDPLLNRDGGPNVGHANADANNIQQPSPAHPAPQPPPAPDNQAAPGVHEPNGPGDNAQKPESPVIPSTLALIAIIASVGWAVASSFAAQLPADTLGLLDSNFCGSWSLMPDLGESVRADDALRRSEKERRAGEYARACYGSRSVASPDQCTFFSTQSIDYKTSKVGCPFKDKSVCAGGNAPIARRFTTDLVDARQIGINTANATKFNRTSICVPLNLDQGYVMEIPPDKYHYDYRYEYHLGARNGSNFYSNYTFRTSGDPFNTELPAYSVNVYESTPYRPNHDYWRPISELLEIDSAENAYLTIMFISSCRIIYRGPSKDEVFPATEEYPPGSGRFRNGDPRARLLACIDWNEVCTPDDKCFSMEVEHDCSDESQKTNLEEQPENRRDEERICSVDYEYTRAALRESTIFKSIHFRLGDALVAQEKVGDYESFKLDDTQWVIESQRLFNTSLARIQYDAFDIGIGSGHEKDTYHRTDPSWITVNDMCKKYKFQLPPDYANINVWPTVFLFLIPPALLLLSLQTPRHFTDSEKIHFKGNWMVFDLVIWAVAMILYFLVIMLYCLIWRWPKLGFDHVREWCNRWLSQRQRQQQYMPLPGH